MTTATLPAGYTYAREYEGYDIYTPDDAGDLSLVVGHQDGYTVVDTSALSWSDADDLFGAAVAAMHAADEAEEGRRESAISREQARHILADAGLEEEWDALGDYWIVTQANGDEELWCQDIHLVTNNATMSWLGSWPGHWSDRCFEGPRQ